MSTTKIKRELTALSNSKQAAVLQRFFKTKKGEYGEGDKFLGLTVPQQRTIVKKYWEDLKLNDIQQLLNSKIHEFRFTALMILVKQFTVAEKNTKKQIFNFYLSNSKNINNWDLVDLSAPNIVGEYLLDKNRSVLYKLAKSKLLWDKRISMLACYTFIKNNQYQDALLISEILVNDSHDLIHKAVGWMLREVGKREQKTAEKFLLKHYKQMPRTMLRYAIEKFPEEKRKFYLKKPTL